MSNKPLLIHTRGVNRNVNLLQIRLNEAIEAKSWELVSALNELIGRIFTTLDNVQTDINQHYVPSEQQDQMLAEMTSGDGYVLKDFWLLETGVIGKVYRKPFDDTVYMVAIESDCCGEPTTFIEVFETFDAALLGQLCMTHDGAESDAFPYAARVIGMTFEDDSD